MFFRSPAQLPAISCIVLVSFRVGGVISLLLSRFDPDYGADQCRSYAVTGSDKCIRNSKNQKKSVGGGKGASKAKYAAKAEKWLSDLQDHCTSKSGPPKGDALLY